MRWEEWSKFYGRILEEFGYSREEDERAARILSEISRGKRIPLSSVRMLIHGADVVVCGNGPNLRDDVLNVDRSKVFIAADGATSTLVKEGIIPQLIVTDLDGNVHDIIGCNRMGSIVVVHAHGDNIDKLVQYVPKLSSILCTTQSQPFDEVYNFGGFTDGDRCFFLAKELGASSIQLIGFYFDDESVDDVKRRKLLWARRLIFQTD